MAEPQNLRDKFNDALASGHPLMARIRLDTMVTMVDSGSFFVDWSSKAPLAARPDLGEGGNLRPVVDLLVEQIECAPVHCQALIAMMMQACAIASPSCRCLPCLSA